MEGRQANDAAKKKIAVDAAKVLLSEAAKFSLNSVVVVVAARN